MVLATDYGEYGALGRHTGRSRVRCNYLWERDHCSKSPRNSERNPVCRPKGETVIMVRKVANLSRPDHSHFFQQEMEIGSQEYHWSRRSMAPAGITSGHHC